MECHLLSATPQQVERSSASFAGLTVLVRVEPGAVSAWSAAARVLASRGARAAVHVLGAPADGDPLLAVEADRLVLEPGPRADADALAFELKRAFSAARGRRPAMRLALAAPPDLTAALRERGLAPYVDDFLASSTPMQSADELLEGGMAGTQIRRLPEGPEAAFIAATAARLGSWFPEGLVRVRDRRLMCGEDRRLPAVASAKVGVPAFLNPRTLDLVTVTASCPSPATVESDVPGAFVERVDVGPVSAFRVRAGAADRFAENVTVGAARSLTVEEIVARHQAAVARQTARIQTDIASGTFILTFEAPGFVAPVTITSRTTIYQEPGTRDLRQSDIRVNGVLFTSEDGVPRLPIIEPERVAAPPLAITLTDVYRYRLAGRESIAGRGCYVVVFAPASEGALYAGRAWIDTTTFAMVRVSAAQTGLKGPIVASEQTDTFAPDADGRWLLVRSDARQTYEGASIRTPIHRLLVIDRHDVNVPDFDARRTAAYASPDVILRDTPAGFRYLKREAGSGKLEAGSRKPEAGIRTVAPPVTRIRTFAAGVIVDPNITNPLPFAGLNYTDFDLFGTGAQFNGFYGGSYGQLAFSAPSIGGSRWQVAGRAFAIASSYNDRAFVAGREQYELDIRQRPAQVAIWVLRPLTPRAAFRFEYDWDYNSFGRTEVTDPRFVVPRNQNAHGVRAGLEFQRGGWQASVWGSHTIRIGWREWGVPERSEFDPAHATFQRFGAGVLRTQALSRRVTTRVEASGVGGRDLDRFSRIAFGTFDNRLHGYPSALIRYDRGVVLRTAAAWSASRAVRVDVFADAASVRDPGFGDRWRPYTGFGLALEAPGPFRTLLAAEWGYGAQGINTDGRTGTHVVRITGYKVF